MEYRDFGKFTLLDHMGKGGVASVYRANDNEAGNIVAIKIFESSARRSPDTVRKLRDREVRMLISIQHPNVVKYYESGNAGDSYYYTMEFVENSLLKRMRHSDGLELDDKIHILRQTCNALQAIHHQGIVHRDIKPGNILLDEAPTGAIHVKVTDLGIAKHVSETDIVRDDEASRRVPGTPKYLSPEQIQLKPVDGRADIFSLGVVAYELLSGDPPFKADTSEEYLRANLNQEAQPVHHTNGEIPEFVSPLLERMLTKNREDRYDSDTLSRDLDLTYQHLVSDAPLVEHSNPDSIYYVPPVPEAEDQAAAPPGSKRWQYVAGGAMVAFGALVCFLFFPRVPEAQQGGAPISLEALGLTTSQSLDRAAKLIDEGRHWRALAILRAVDRGEMSEGEAGWWRSLQSEVQERLAPPLLKEGLEQLRARNVTDAEIILDKMKELFPQAQATSDLEKEIRERGQAIEAAGQWEQTMQRLRGALAAERWKDALHMAQDLQRELGDDPQKRADITKVIARCLNGWQEQVLDARPDGQAIKECLETLERYLGAEWAAGGLDDRRAELNYHMAKHFLDQRLPEEALNWCEKIIEDFPDSLAADKAETLRAEIIRSPNLDPRMLAVVARELENNGFKSTVWYAGKAEGGAQKREKDYFAIIQRGGAGRHENYLETVRPIRSNLGFVVSVKFRFKTQRTRATETCRVGLRIKDRLDNLFVIYFDGDSYQLARSFRGMVGSSELRGAAGDEGENWHELSMRYQYDLSKLEVLVDGKPVGAEDYKVELGVIRVRLFTTIAGEGAVKAEFQDFEIKLP